MTLKQLDKDVQELIKKRSKGDMEWLSSSIVYLVESGSRSYGTNTPESDRDYKGIVIPPKEYLYGLRTFKSMEISTGQQESKNSSDDIDITLYSLHEFVRLSLNANPNLIEMLFVEEESILIDHPTLREHRHMFLTNKLGKSYGGYGTSMKMKFTRKLENGEYDGKELMQLVRIFETGQEALLTGDMYTKRPNAKELLNIRQRQVNGSNREETKEILDFMERKQADFMKAEEKSVLPTKPNVRQVEKLLMRLTEQYLGM